MQARILAATVLLAAALAGCGASDAPDAGEPAEQPDLGAGKGAVSGIVIDDRYRPVPGALVLMTQLGLTATADGQGQFSFVDILPGAYLLKAQADGHEAAPVTVDVHEGQYAEVEVMARRIFSEGSRVITTQYSVFIPCAIDFIANGFVLDCTADQSGDTFRAGFVSDYTEHGKNATYLVTEMLANKHDRYEVQVRCESNGRYYAVQRIDARYARMTMPFGEPTPDSPVPPEYDETNPWENDCSQLNTILFSDSTGREELQGLGAPVCCGAGVHFGIKANFVQSLFIGQPEVDIATYEVLKPDA